VGARLASLSTGADVVFCEELAEDPAVAEWLGHRSSESFQETLRGFEEPLQLLRAAI